jgi:hypothetical protein
MERARKLHRLLFNPIADVEKPRTALRTEINAANSSAVWSRVAAPTNGYQNERSVPGLILLTRKLRKKKPK